MYDLVHLYLKAINERDFDSVDDKTKYLTKPFGSRRWSIGVQCFSLYLPVIIPSKAKQLILKIDILRKRSTAEKSCFAIKTDKSVKRG